MGGGAQIKITKRGTFGPHVCEIWKIVLLCTPYPFSPPTVTPMNLLTTSVPDVDLEKVGWILRPEVDKHERVSCLKYSGIHCSDDLQGWKTGKLSSPPNMITGYGNSHNGSSARYVYRRGEPNLQTWKLANAIFISIYYWDYTRFGYTKLHNLRLLNIE